MSDDAGDLSLTDLFRMEVTAHLATLEAGLREDPSGWTAEWRKEAHRAAHSIKGAAGIVGVGPVRTVAAAVEEAFEEIDDGGRSGSAALVALLLEAVAFIASSLPVADEELEAWCEATSREAERIAQRFAAGEPAEEKAGESPLRRATRSTGAFAPPLPDDLSALSMIEIFRLEIDGRLAEMNTALVSLESEPGSPSHLEALMRGAHSIKGAARIVGLSGAVRLAHAMEDCFVAAQEGRVDLDPAAIDRLLAAMDLLAEMSRQTEADAGAWLEGHDAEIAATATAIAAIGRGAMLPPAAAPAVEGTEALPPAAASPPPVAAPADRPTAALRGGGSALEVRIRSDSLDRLLALAGETLVESRWLDPFADALFRLRRTQDELADLFERVAAAVPDGAEAFVFETQQKLADLREQLAARLVDLDTYQRRQGNLSSRLYREVVASRMRPFGDGVQGFPRLVRDVARELGRVVRLEVDGLDTEVDRDILDRLEAPLNHLLRNALDHGIEDPAERLAAGKPESGLLRLEARHQAGMLMITLEDDGRGIDRDRLRARILAKGLAPLEMTARMADAELLEFLFLPGFSTRDEVTQLSGRGVGLDVVQKMARDVGGSVRVASVAGKGTTFFLQLPLTRSVLRALVVEIDAEPWAIPLARIDRAVRVDRGSLRIVEGRPYLDDGDSAIGLVSARQAVGWESALPSSPELFVVVVSDRFVRYGLVVDRFLGEHDLVVRPLDRRFGKVQDVEAVALLADGSPVLVVDVADLVRSIEDLLSGGRLQRVGRRGEEGGERRRKRILVVDDSITVREVQRKILEGRGYQVEVAVDGMDGWNAVRTGAYDLVISDVDMPRMTGIELVRTIRAEESLRGLPVMIVSYKDREDDRLAGLDAGASHYLTKGSFHDETMLRAVVDLIGKSDE